MTTSQLALTKSLNEFIDLMDSYNSYSTLVDNPVCQHKRDQLKWLMDKMLLAAKGRGQTDFHLLNMLYSGLRFDIKGVVDSYDKVKWRAYELPEIDLNYAVSLRYAGNFKASNEHLYKVYQSTRSMDALRLLSDGYARTMQFGDYLALNNEFVKASIDIDGEETELFEKANAYLSSKKIDSESIANYAQHCYGFMYSKSLFCFDVHTYLQDYSDSSLLVSVIRITDEDATAESIVSLNESFIDSLLELNPPPSIIANVVTKFERV